MQRGCCRLCCFSSLRCSSMHVCLVFGFSEDNEYFRSDLCSIWLLLKHHLPLQDTLKALPQPPLEEFVERCPGLCRKATSQVSSGTNFVQSLTIPLVSDCICSLIVMMSYQRSNFYACGRSYSFWTHTNFTGPVSMGCIESAVCPPSGWCLPKHTRGHTHPSLPPRRTATPPALLQQSPPPAGDGEGGEEDQQPWTPCYLCVV